MNTLFRLVNTLFLLICVSSLALADVAPPKIIQKPQRPLLLQKRTPVKHKIRAFKSAKLTLKSRALRVHKQTVSFHPDARRRKRRYKVYHFRKQAFFKRFSSLKAADGQTIKVIIQHTRTKRAQIPVGTITTIHHQCMIVPKKSASKRAIPKASRPTLYILPQQKYRLLRDNVVGKMASLPLKQGKAITFKGASMMSFNLISPYRRSAVYMKVLLPKAAYDKTRKQSPNANVLLIQFTKVHKRRYQPPRGMPSPIGGFLHVKYVANIIKVIK